MTLSPIEFIWVGGQHNWKRSHRRYIKSFLKPCLEFGQSIVRESLRIPLDIDTVEVELCPRDVGYRATADSASQCSFYFKKYEITRKKMEGCEDYYAWVATHEGVHCSRMNFINDDSIIELAATEGLAYAAEIHDCAEYVEDISGLGKEAEELLASFLEDPATHREGPPTEEESKWLARGRNDWHNLAERIGMYCIQRHLCEGYTYQDMIYAPPEDLITL